MPPEPQKPIATTALAYRGQAVKYDEWAETPTPMPAQSSVTIVSQASEFQAPQSADYEDLRQINQELIALLIRLNTLRKELSRAERIAAQEKHLYLAAKKRTLIGLSGGSAAEREAMAELKHENEQVRMIVAEQVVKEIVQHSRDCRTMLDALKELSTNIRRQQDIQ